MQNQSSAVSSVIDKIYVACVFFTMSCTFKRLEVNFEQQFYNISPYNQQANKILPYYKGFQLIGDSQLLRFSHQILNQRPYFRQRELGYCVSGQKVADLKERLLHHHYPISEKVIVLIGSNDLAYQTPFQNFCSSYKSVLYFLKKSGTRQIILLTIPPTPKWQGSEVHWTRLKQFNLFLTTLKEEGAVYVFDLAPVFISYNNTVKADYYERYYSTGRIDMKHLNKSGLKFVKFIIDVNLERYCIS